MVQVEILTVVDNVLRKVFQKVDASEAPFPRNLL
jgi:hypothetical protein